jgi:SAM-dependent methyltransferase
MAAELPPHGSWRINLGAGSLPEADWVNVDVADIPGIDVVADLDAFPWPFEDGVAERVKAFDIYEHVWHPLDFMRECWRILRVGGVLNIHTAYWKNPNSYRDPDHKRFLTEESWDYWVPGTYLNSRYGAAYARGSHFEKVRVALDTPVGDLDVTLRKVAS